MSGVPCSRRKEHKMRSKARDAASVILRLIVVACSFCGILLTTRGSDFMSEGKAFLYFTVQSNIWIGATCIVFLVLGAVRRVKTELVIPQWLYALKYMFTISITLTFLVFALMLSGDMDADYLLSPSNLTLHFLCPIAAIADYIIADVEFEGKKRHILLAVVMPFYYCAFVFVCVITGTLFYTVSASDVVSTANALSASDVTSAADFYSGSGKVPYYFFDWETLGWFSVSEKGLGVVYWMIILICGLLAFGALYIFINQKRRAALARITAD